jgi:exosome complex exonuclease RRP6
MPLDQGTLFRTLSPVTPIAKDRAADLLEVIKKAKIEGATGPEWRDVVRTLKTTAAQAAEKGLPSPPAAEAIEYPTAARYESSQFWGPVLEVREPLTPPEYSAIASAEALRLSLPLPPMPRTVSEAREKLGDTKPAPKPAAAPAPAPEEDSKEIFTVKELGGPRKRKAAAAEEAEAAPSLELDEINLDTGSSADALEKPSKKQRQKNKKNKAQPQPEGDAQDDVPFNYDAAESVLHAQPAQAAPSRVSKRFAPYAKAMEAPAGARKHKREIAGKQFTFR